MSTFIFKSYVFGLAKNTDKLSFSNSYVYEIVSDIFLKFVL